MKIRLTPTRKPRIEMLPLIDIVFLLLVVFIYAMLSMAVHKGLPVRLPSSATAALDKQTTLSVTVQNGVPARLYVDKEPVALADLSKVLRERAAGLRAGNPEGPGVLLFADRTVSYQQLFQVLDQISRAGLARVSLQAEATGAENE